MPKKGIFDLSEMFVFSPEASNSADRRTNGIYRHCGGIQKSKKDCSESESQYITCFRRSDGGEKKKTKAKRGRMRKET